MKSKKTIINLVLIVVLALSSAKLVSRSFALKKNKETVKELKLSNSDILKSKNEDYRFWLKIKGTQVDYPVVQSNDNNFYLGKDFNKQDNVAGTPFLDYRNDSINNKNTIIYAHNMKDGSMFGELDKFKDVNFFNENKQIILNVDENISTYEIFSVYVNDNSTDYLKVDFSEEDYANYLNDAIKKSMHTSDVEIDTDDKIITLSTCSYEFKNARLVIHAKLLK